ncbi:TonB-dependent receptor [Sphingopyxis fribergensis]
MKRLIDTRRDLLLAVALAALACGASAHAAEAAEGGADGGAANMQAPNPATGDSGSPDEAAGDIIVTAQRRNERLQDVPVATTVVGADRLTASRITEANDLPTLVPNLRVSGNFAAVPKVTMRGIGTNDFVPSLNPGVGTYFDDVYIGLAIGQNFQLYDLDRVEVLRGPQGTLYGKNTNGGAIKYITRKPEAVGGRSYASLTYGNYDRFELEGAINLPISDDWSARISGVMRKQDGYLGNPVTGRRGGFTDAWAARGQLRYNPSDAVDILVQVFDGISDGDSGARRLEGPLAGGTDILGNSSPGFRETSRDVAAYDKIRQSGINLIAGIDTPLGRLNSITSYLDVSRDNLDDGDNGPGRLVEIKYDTTAWSAGQELRLSGDTGPLRWSLGGQYVREKFDSNFYLEFFHCTLDPVPCTLNPSGAALPPGYINFTTFPNTPAFAALGIVGLPIANTIDYPWKQTNDSYAGFGDATWSITDKLQLTGGLRYSYEKRRYSGESIIFVTAAPAVRGGLFPRGFDYLEISKSWDNLSGRLVLDYKPTPDQLLYLSYASGFRSGNFNSAAYSSLIAVSQPVDPEYVDSFEFGAKTQWFDRKLTLNLAAFYMKYKDLQVAVFRDATQILTNAASSDIKGVEIELAATPARGFTVRASGSYLDARYKDFIYRTAPLTDLSGNRLVNAPKWSGSLSADYRSALTSQMNVSFGGDIRYQSKVYFTPFNDAAISQDGYAIMNLRAGLEWPDEGINVEAYLTNATDKVAAVEGLTVGAPFGSNSRAYNRPRMYGLTLRKSF